MFFFTKNNIFEPRNLRINIYSNEMDKKSC